MALRASGWRSSAGCRRRRAGMRRAPLCSDFDKQFNVGLGGIERACSVSHSGLRHGPGTWRTLTGLTGRRQFLVPRSSFPVEEVALGASGWRSSARRGRLHAGAHALPGVLKCQRTGYARASIQLGPWNPSWSTRRGKGSTTGCAVAHPDWLDISGFV